jgi:hypothetical protein
LLANTLPEGFAENRLKLMPRQCKTIALEAFRLADAFQRVIALSNSRCNIGVAQWLNTAYDTQTISRFPAKPSGSLSALSGKSLSGYELLSLTEF